jgi:hypothetical protein
MTARFLLIEFDHYDLWDSAVMGCGVALPDRIDYELPNIKMRGTMGSVWQLLALLRLNGNDVRVVWVDDPTGLPRTESDSPPVTTSNAGGS